MELKRACLTTQACLNSIAFNFLSSKLCFCRARPHNFDDTAALDHATSMTKNSMSRIRKAVEFKNALDRSCASSEVRGRMGRVPRCMRMRTEKGQMKISSFSGQFLSQCHDISVLNFIESHANKTFQFEKVELMRLFSGLSLNPFCAHRDFRKKSQQFDILELKSLVRTRFDKLQRGDDIENKVGHDIFICLSPFATRHTLRTKLAAEENNQKDRVQENADQRTQTTNRFESGKIEEASEEKKFARPDTHSKDKT